MRTRIANIIIISLFVLLVIALFRLEILQGAKFRQLSSKNCIRLILQPGARGKILDRQGEIIVDNYLTYDVMVIPQEAKQLDKIFEKISSILEVPEKGLRAKFRKGYLGSFMPVVVANNVEKGKAIAIEELKFDLSGVIIQPRPLRYYPYGKLACHVLGYLSEIDRWRLTRLADYGYKTKDIVGYSGVEEVCDYYLRQEDGALSVEVDHKGKMQRVLGYKPAQNGKDVQLTIDLRVQKIAEDSLRDRKGSIIVMDPHTGEIIAMVSSPGFDPSDFVKRSSALSRYFTDSDSALLNRSISAVYPPASTFKLIVASAALEQNKINLGTSFLCAGSTLIGSRRFKCWDTHGQQDILQAIAHSCDVFFYKTGILLGAQAIHDYAIKFGFGKTTNFELPYEKAGFIPDPLWKRVYRFQSWYDGDTANLAIGQGDVLVSPLQLTRAAAVFANRGLLVNPYIIKTIDGRAISGFPKKPLRVGLKDRTIDTVRSGMRRVVSDPKGTANILSGLKAAVAGKTGTAQVSGKQPHGWFVGFFPFENPEFVICVFLENSGSGYNSCVVANQIIENMAKEGVI